MKLKSIAVFLFAFFTVAKLNAQLQWQNVDAQYAPLPSSVHVYKTTGLLDGKPNIAYYVIADLKDKKLEFTSDTSAGRRLTPTQFYQKNQQPLVVVNTTFFSFETNKSLNVVMKDGALLAYNVHSIAGKGKDTLTYRHTTGSAIGISKKRTADVAWLFADSNYKYPVAFEKDPVLVKDSGSYYSKYTFAPFLRHSPTMKKRRGVVEKWKMQTAVGGGPVLMHDGNIRVTNNEELKFTGKAIDDKHPRTAMGYTKDNKIIILVVEGRHPGTAEGATLTQMAQIFKDLGCWEAINLDGGGSSCMLVNGKETITVSDKDGQRSVPAVFIIKNKN